MKLFKKLFAIVLCLALVFGTVPMMVFAADDTPAMVQSDGMVVLADGLKYQGAFGNGGQDAGNHLPGGKAEFSFSNPTLTKYDYFEFDFYVDNFANFQARNVIMELNVRHINGTHRATIAFTNQVTQSGWNHIIIALDALNLSDSDLNTLGVIRFYMGLDAGQTGATDNYKIANICITKDQTNTVPDMPDADGLFVLADGLKFEGTYGSTAITQQGHLPGYKPADVTFTNSGFSKYSHIEFDYYVENINNIAARNTKLYLNLRAGYSNSKGTYEFQDQLTQNGWNHIKVAITDKAADVLDSLDRVRFYIDIDAGDAGAADAYKIANICATADFPIPGMIESIGMAVIKEGVAIDSTLGSAAGSGGAHPNGYNSSNPAEVVFTNPGLSDFSHIEFDYYVANFDNFNARDIVLTFNMRTNSQSKKSYEFQDQITQSGWNHVKIAMDLTADTLNSITKLRLYMDRSADEINSADDRFVLANICATVELKIPEMIEADEVFVIKEGTAVDNTLGSAAGSGGAHPNGYGANGQNPAEVVFTNPELADYDYFEFDYYVANFDNFNARDIVLTFNVRTNTQSKKSYEFQDQITKSGWNHVVIAIADLGLDANTLNSIVKARLYMDRNASDIGADDRFVLANICATHNHSYEAEVTAPTCKSEGYTTYTCACGDSYTDNTTAVVDHNYVDGYCSFGCGTEEPAIVYTFSHTVQLTTSEPWQLVFNAQVNDDENFDYSTLSDYGMYIVEAKGLDAVPTAEELAVIGKAYTKADGIYNSETNQITVVYKEKLATYEMDKEFYVVFYAADKKGNISYGEVKTRSYKLALEMYTDDYGTAVMNFVEKTQAMFEATADYRETYKGRYELTETTAVSATSYDFSNRAEGKYTFGHTMQLSTIEPWALIFNCAVRENGTVIDYSACDEYGVVILTDVDAAPSLDDILTNENALVYSTYLGEGLKDGYICVDYTNNNSIKTSEMDKAYYAVFFVKVDGVYHFGDVKTRSMMTVADQYLNIEEEYEGQEDLNALLNVMKNLFTATKEYIAWANNQ